MLGRGKEEREAGREGGGEEETGQGGKERKEAVHRLFNHCHSQISCHSCESEVRISENETWGIS